jgi:hypothetical protein
MTSQKRLKVVVIQYLEAQVAGDYTSFTFDALRTSEENIRLISQKRVFF